MIKPGDLVTVDSRYPSGAQTWNTDSLFFENSNFRVRVVALVRHGDVCFVVSVQPFTDQRRVAAVSLLFRDTKIGWISPDYLEALT